MKIVWKLLFAGSIFFFCVWFGQQANEAAIQINDLAPDWILDAGHGGEDGGAVSPSGVRESEINLSIAQRLDLLLGFCGEFSMLLRDKDISLHNSDAVTLREKKISDLRNRVAIVGNYPAATLISIHQNSYPEEKYHGTQVFYSPTEGSLELADDIQAIVTEVLQPDNSRQEKEIPDFVYLMNQIHNRAILIECGFLTNPTDEFNLQQCGYQKKLAMVLTAGLVRNRNQTL